MMLKGTLVLPWVARGYFASIAGDTWAYQSCLGIYLAVLLSAVEPSCVEG